MNIRLSYSTTRDLPLGLSILGYVFMLIGLSTAVGYTVYSKGRVPSPVIYHLTDPTTSGYTCNTTTIYPGQLFASLEATFFYASLTSFPYLATPFHNCTVDNTSQLIITGPPIGWPRWDWNYTVNCQTGLMDDSSDVAFSITQLNHGPQVNQGGLALGIWNMTVTALTNADASVTCYGGRVVGISGGPAQYPTYTFFQDGNNPDPCYDSDSSDPFVAYLDLLYGNITVGAMYDFDPQNHALSPLPGVLYSCTMNNSFIWAPGTTILFDCYTIMAATIAPLYTIVIFLLKKLHGKPRREEMEAEAVPLARRESGLSLSELKYAG